LLDPSPFHRTLRFFAGHAHVAPRDQILEVWSLCWTAKSRKSRAEEQLLRKGRQSCLSSWWTHLTPGQRRRAKTIGTFAKAPEDVIDVNRDISTTVGLASKLNELGLPDLTIQRILRHSNLTTTRNIYIKVRETNVIAGMAQLEAEIRRVENVKSEVKNQKAERGQLRRFSTPDSLNKHLFNIF